MIKATELRLNNIVSVNGILGRVQWIQENSISVEYFERQDNLSNGIITHEEKLEPIRLTSEIFKKCGFYSRININNQYYYLSNIFIYGKGNFVQIGEYGGTTICKLDYLHQLQNLVFALTGIEVIYTP